jgi:hypothetical protein
MVLKLFLDFLDHALKVLFRLFKILFLILNVLLLSLYHFLETSHTVQEFMREIHKALAICTPKIIEHLGFSELKTWASILQLPLQLGVCFITSCDSLVTVLNFTVQKTYRGQQIRILTVIVVQFFLEFL